MSENRFEYRTVDVLMHRGRPAIDPVLNEMAREGWRPITIISPADDYPSYSIVFERACKEDNPYHPDEEFRDWIRWEEIHKGEEPPHP